jgi:hypothetical protein
MVGAGRVLTHPSGYSGCRAEEGPCAAYARGSGHSFAVHRDGAFRHSNEPNI